MNFNKKYNNGNTILSERLKKLRKESKLTQEQLAELIENNGGDCSSSNYVSMLETAKRNISKPMAYCLARIFQIEADYLLNENVEYPTTAEKLKAEHDKRRRDSLNKIADFQQQASYMESAIVYLAAVNGYTVDFKDIRNSVSKTLETGIGTVADVFKDYMIFSRNGEEEFSLSLEEANHFGNILSENFMTYTEWNYKKK